MAHYTFTVRYSEALVRNGVKRHFASLLKSEITTGLYVVLCVLICLLVYDLSRGRASWIDGAAGTVIILAPTLLLYSYRAHLDQALSRLKQMREPSARFDATTESLTVTSDMGSSTFPWHRFKGILQGNNLWVLVLGQNTSMTLPIENIDPMALKFIREQVSSHAAV